MRASEWAYIWDKAVPQIRIGICLFLLPFYFHLFLCFMDKKKINIYIYCICIYMPHSNGIVCQQILHSSFHHSITFLLFLQIAHNRTYSFRPIAHLYCYPEAMHQTFSFLNIQHKTHKLTILPIYLVYLRAYWLIKHR